MTLSAAALRLMAEKGLSALDIAEIAEAMDVRRDPTAAERQQRRRNKVKAEQAERDASRRDVTRDASPHDNILPPQQDLPPDEAIASSPPKSGRSRKSTGMTSLPSAWEPVLTPAAQAIVDGWPPGWLAARLEEFRNHASDKGRKSKDWQAAFRTWLSKADEWGRKNGTGRQNRDAVGPVNPMVRAAIERQARRSARPPGGLSGLAGDWAEGGGGIAVLP